MEYTYLELLIYLLIYSAVGWLIETCVVAVKERRFCNRGFLTLPLLLSRGITMVILILILPTMTYHYIIQFFTVLIVASVVEYMANHISKYLSKKGTFGYSDASIFEANMKGALYSVILACCYYLVYLMLHPLVFLLVHMIPTMVGWILCVGLLVLTLLDLASVAYAVRKNARADQREDYVEEYRRKHLAERMRISEGVYYFIWNRLDRAYPDIEAEPRERETYVFAKGICLDKVIWIFLICALGGDVIETFFVRATSGVWMSRSSVIYGPFSIVWGFGAVILTTVLQRFAGKADRYVFIAGSILGGVYEYMCSVFTEVFFGTKFWDYSDMPFNFGGRTNLLFCIFWGILSVVWIKICYPALSRQIEKIPPLTGKIITWVLVFFMICDALLSAMAMLRYTQRAVQPVPENAVEAFLDQQYDDDFIEQLWPNMVVEDHGGHGGAKENSAN